jgi:hypothetical protein
LVLLKYKGITKREYKKEWDRFEKFLSTLEARITARERADGTRSRFQKFLFSSMDFTNEIAWVYKKETIDEMLVNLLNEWNKAEEVLRIAGEPPMFPETFAATLRERVASVALNTHFFPFIKGYC